MSASSLLSRRNGAVTLKGHLQIETRRNSLPQTVKVEKKIEPLRVELKDLFTKLLDVHDDGEQCRIERVRSKEDGKVRLCHLARLFRTASLTIFQRIGRSFEVVLANPALLSIKENEFWEIRKY